MLVHKALVSFGFLVPATQWWFIVGVTLVVFFVLLALVLLWAAWQSLRTIPDQRDIGDDGLLGLVSSEAPPTPALATEASVTTPLPVPPVAPMPAASFAPPPALHVAPASSPPEAATEDIAAYWSENPLSAAATSSPAPHAKPVLPVETLPRVTAEPVVPAPAALSEVGLHSEAILPDPDAVIMPLTQAPVAGTSTSEPVSPPPGLLTEDIRAQLTQSAAPTSALPKTTGPLDSRPTGPLPPSPPLPPPPLSELEDVSPAPRAGLTERLPVQRKSLRPPAATPKQDESAQRAIAPAPPSTSTATTAVIAASETVALSCEAKDAAVTDQSRSAASAPAVVPPTPLPLPVQQVSAVRPQPTGPQTASPSASSVTPPRFLADDRPTGIRREVTWLGIGLVVYAIVLGGLVVVFFPTVRNWLLPPDWAERVAAIPRGLGLESPPPPPPVAKQVEVRQYANTYSSVPKGAGGKPIRTVTIAGLVKNITNETLYNLQAEIELYPRAPEALPERRTIYLVPSRLEPQQEGRYTLMVTDAEYRQSSLKRIVTGDGKDVREVPAIFVEGTLAPPSEAEAKTTTARSAALNR